MNHWYEKFQYAFVWSSVEAIGYQLILLCHEWFLSLYVSGDFYGYIGTILAIIFLATNVFNFGLYQSWQPFFVEATRSKETFRQVILRQLCINIALLATLPPLFFMLLGSHYSRLLDILAISNDRMWVLNIMWLLIMTEGMKRTIRHLLYVPFKNKPLAFIEIGTLILYCSIVWTSYGIVGSLSFTQILVPFAILSILSLGVLCILTKQYYDTLPSHGTLKEPIFARILFHRISCTFYQILSQLSSSNLWIPLFASIFDIQRAGILTLVSHGSYSLSRIIQKLFGTTSGAAFAHIRYHGPLQKQRLFHKINRVLYITLGGIIIMFAATYPYMRSHFDVPSTTWIPLSIFLIVHFTENILVTYREFFFVEERAHIFTAYTTLGTLVLFSVLPWLWSFSPLHALVGTLAIRAGTLGMISLYAYRMWKLRL
ncbi:hypothetical protein JW872_02555 [Candidatus Babeliales bacterium]|nr:hypothetical protein [Candidatus Babeliales bacterium]